MPPWNLHDILLRVTNPPVTDANGFLQADDQGVINRWDIINAIEHAPWTTKQLYAMRAAEKNSRAKQFASFNGWNNSYSYNPGDRHSITESDLWAKHRGYWYHHDGRPIIPIQKQFDRAVRLGNSVAKPIVSLLRRARSYSALPRGPPGQDDDDDIDLPTATPHRRLRRRATISRMSDNFQDDLSDDLRESQLGRRPTSRGMTWKRPSSKVHGLTCLCWKCDEMRHIMCGRYRIPQDGSYDKNKGTGADDYSETWDEWNIRTDFARKASRAPVETLDLRHRSRPKQPRNGDGHPVGSGSRPTHHVQAMPLQTRRPEPPVASSSRLVPPAPVVPDHVASHFANARLLNDEQTRYAKERADWKAARLQERRELERDRERRPRGPVDEWRRAIDVPQREEWSSRTELVPRPKETRAPERRDVPGRRHRHEAPEVPKPQEVPVTAHTKASRAHEPRPAPETAPPVARQPPRPAPAAARQGDSHRRHQRLAPNQPCEDEDSDPFDKRAYHRAQLREVYRPIQPPADPAPRQDPLRPRAPAGFSGPTDAEYGYIYGRLQTHLDAQPRPSSHTPAAPPNAQAAPGRQPKPARDIGLGRPPVLRTEKVLPSLPSFPTLASSGDAGPSRDRDQPSRRVRATYIQTPPEDPPIRRDRRGSNRTDESDLDDSISSRGAPRAGDKGWREAWSDAQIAAKKQELKKVLEEYEGLAAAKARRERKKR